MDLNKIDKIVSDYVKDESNKKAISTLDTVIPMCERVLTEKLDDYETNKWSRNFNVNDSIKIVSLYIKSIDDKMFQSFNEEIKNAKILPREQFKDESKYYNCVDENGIVHIYYENTPKDIFIIFHEMLHKLNENKEIDKNGKKILTDTRDYFGESVSILGEMLLGEYLVESGTITENDFNLRKHQRLNGAKEEARNVLIENELIKLKLSNLNINEENLLKVIKNESNPIKKSVFFDELSDKRRIKQIEKEKNLSLNKSQRYVIAHVLVSEMLKHENVLDSFLKLHYEVGNDNCNIKNLFNNLLSSYPSLGGKNA